MPLSGATKLFPRSKGGGAERQGVVRRLPEPIKTTR
jgi:hypothetical protein